MDIQVFKKLGDAKHDSMLTVDPIVFGEAFREGLVHQVLVAFQAGARQGTKQNKNRSAVSGGGKKPWRQKKLGRARAGTIRSPLWRGGGVTFAAENRDYTKKVNRKMYRKALASILSEQHRRGNLKVVKSLEIEDHKTKTFLKAYDADLPKFLLLITDQLEEKLLLSTNNLHQVGLIDMFEINPYSLFAAEQIVMTEAALKYVEQWLS